MRTIFLVIAGCCALSAQTTIPDTTQFKDTRTAVNTALSAIDSAKVDKSILTTLGDLPYRGASGWTRLPASAGWLHWTGTAYEFRGLQAADIPDISSTYQRAISGAPTTWPSTFTPPGPGASTLGGVTTGKCSSGQHVDGYNADGSPHCTADTGGADLSGYQQTSTKDTNGGYVGRDGSGNASIPGTFSAGNVAITGTLSAPSFQSNDTTHNSADYLTGKTSGGIAWSVANVAGTAVTLLWPTDSATADSGKVFTIGNATCPDGLPTWAPQTCRSTSWATASGTATNGTNGQALTSNGSGGFGTPVTLGNAATKSTGTTSGTVAAGDDSRITGAEQTTNKTGSGSKYCSSTGTLTSGNIITADAAGNCVDSGISLTNLLASVGNPFWNTSVLASATEGSTYTQALSASGGTAPLTYSCPATCGLPSGLSISGTSITGTPGTGTSAGSPYSVTLRVTDSASHYSEQTFSLAVTQGTVATPTASPASGTTVNAGDPLTWSSTTPSVTFHYTSGAATPADPTCSTGGAGNGTASGSGTQIFKVIACKSGWVDSAVATFTYTVTVAPPFTVTQRKPAAGDPNDTTCTTGNGTATSLTCTFTATPSTSARIFVSVATYNVTPGNVTVTDNQGAGNLYSCSSPDGAAVEDVTNKTTVAACHTTPTSITSSGTFTVTAHTSIASYITMHIFEVRRSGGTWDNDVVGTNTASGGSTTGTVSASSATGNPGFGFAAFAYQSSGTGNTSGATGWAVGAETSKNTNVLMGLTDLYNTSTSTGTVTASINFALTQSTGYAAALTVGK